MNIAVFFGGKSCEHNISVATGVMTANAVRERAHNIICIYIDRKGEWLTSPDFFDINSFKCDRPKGKRVYLRAGDNRLHYHGSLKKVIIDCAVLCMHGKNGEDGTLQGLLQLSNVAYTGCGVLGSAVGMDKSVMKKLFRADKLPVISSITAYKHQLLTEIAAVADEKLGFPVIVKPANLGSSIGIGIAHDYHELLYALNVAFEWDGNVLIEKAMTNFTELNCAVIGDRENSVTSEIERPKSEGEFLSYNDKYHNKQKMAAHEIPANIPAALAEKVKKLAVRAFDSINGCGIARVDFILDNDTGKLYVNEINTIPGSLSTYLFPEIPQGDIIGRLVDLAIKQHKEQNSFRYVYADSSFVKKGV